MFSRIPTLKTFPTWDLIPHKAWWMSSNVHPWTVSQAKASGSQWHRLEIKHLQLLEIGWISELCKCNSVLEWEFMIIKFQIQIGHKSPRSRWGGSVRTHGGQFLPDNSCFTLNAHSTVVWHEQSGPQFRTWSLLRISSIKVIVFQGPQMNWRIHDFKYLILAQLLVLAILICVVRQQVVSRVPRVKLIQLQRAGSWLEQFTDFDIYPKIDKAWWGHSLFLALPWRYLSTEKVL